MHASSLGSAKFSSILILNLWKQCFFPHVENFEIQKDPSWSLQFISRNNYCKSLVCVMGLIVRLQSDPVRAGSVWLLISAFAHWKKGAADLTKQTRTTAGWQQYITWPKIFSSPNALLKNVISDQRYQTIHWACAKRGHTAEMYRGKWYNSNRKWKLDSWFRFGVLFIIFSVLGWK